MTSKAMRRAERTARAMAHGLDILQFVRRPKIRKLLVDAAEAGSPPITAISSAVQEIVGTNDPQTLASLKQFTGLCVRAVLEEEGFELLQTGVRVSKDPFFQTGSVYRRSEKKKLPHDYVLLARLLEALDEDQADFAVRYLQQRKTKRGAQRQ